MLQCLVASGSAWTHTGRCLECRGLRAHTAVGGPIAVHGAQGMEDELLWQLAHSYTLMHPVELTMQRLLPHLR